VGFPFRAGARAAVPAAGSRVSLPAFVRRGFDAWIGVPAFIPAALLDVLHVVLLAGARAGQVLLLAGSGMNRFCYFRHPGGARPQTHLAERVALAEFFLADCQHRIEETPVADVRAFLEVGVVASVMDFAGGGQVGEAQRI